MKDNQNIRQKNNVEKKEINKNIKETLTKEETDKLDGILNNYKDQKGVLINILHEVQDSFGFLPRKVQIYIAEKTGIPFSEIYGVVSFYSLFSMRARGKYTIEVCMGTACYVKGAEKILNTLKKELKIEPGEITEDGLFTIETTRCKGICHKAPVIGIGEDVYENFNMDDLSKILEKYE